MMIKAMEVSGIEGNFRTTCEAVLKVLRTHKDSLMVRQGGATDLHTM
jgi:FKBP12-rapamycin complex-associated protein